jgi:hypothetical protein
MPRAAAVVMHSCQQQHSDCPSSVLLRATYACYLHQVACTWPHEKAEPAGHVSLLPGVRQQGMYQVTQHDKHQYAVEVYSQYHS